MAYQALRSGCAVFDYAVPTSSERRGSFTLIRTIMAQAAARNDVSPRSISFTGAMQTLEAFQPLLELAAARDRVDRMRLCHDLLDAIVTHRVGD
jgi:hypothetical protein